MLFTIPKEKFLIAGDRAKKLSISLAVVGVTSLLLSRDLNGLGEKLSFGGIMLARENLIKNGDPDLNDVDFYAFVPFFLKLKRKEN